MKHTWEEAEKDAEHGLVRLWWRFVWTGAIMVVLLVAVAWPMGWLGEAMSVARVEFGPKAALAKYEWFKSAAAELEKKMADVKVYEVRLKSLEEAYAGKTRSEWAREDREQWNICQAELAGVKASYNSLAAEYNAAMAKWNWRFAEVGNLPEGAAEPLPREFKPYMDK